MDEANALVEKWRSQSRKGFLDLCVLVLLEGAGPTYGLDMMERLTEAGLEVSEGTLYPLLARMTRERSLEATWTTPETGHPRKYYRLSSQGRGSLPSLRGEFEAQIAAYRRLGGGAP
jgi:PadR family transcriptional regulator PadR